MSSARVEMLVKSRNERNPIFSSQQDEDLERLLVITRRKVGMTSNHHAPWRPVYTRYNGVNKEKRSREAERISKITSQFDCSLRTLDYMKLNAASQIRMLQVNTFLPAYTARHTMGA